MKNGNNEADLISLKIIKTSWAKVGKLQVILSKNKFSKHISYSPRKLTKIYRFVFKKYKKVKCFFRKKNWQSIEFCLFNFCLRPSGSETYKLACPWLTPSLPPWLWSADLLKLWHCSFPTHHTPMLVLWNFDRASLTTRQLIDDDLTYIFQLLTAVISC